MYLRTTSGSKRSALRQGQVAFSLALPDVQDAALEVHVGLLQGDDFPAAQSGSPPRSTKRSSLRSPMLFAASTSRSYSFGS